MTETRDYNASETINQSTSGTICECISETSDESTSETICDSLSEPS